MALRLQRRSAFGWPATAAPSANPTLGMAVHYEGSATGIASWSHDRCIQHWQKTRRFHMEVRGWKDIGYSYGCCRHYVLEGRGKDKAQAAQPGGNTTYYSCTFMTGPGEKPHPGQVENFRALRAWLMADDVARAVRPHSSFVATGCPGDVLRAMITDGTLSRAPSEDDMPTLDEILDGVVRRLSNPNGDFMKALANEDGLLMRRVGNAARRRVLEGFAEDGPLPDAARDKIAHAVHMHLEAHAEPTPEPM